jgi:outer membrane lipoprotein-sorting protein
LRKQEFSFFLLIFTSFLFAQEVFDSPVSTETRDDVNQIFSNLASHDLMRADYKQVKSIAALNRDITGSGRFIFHGERGMAWIVERPFPMELVVNDREIIQRSRSGQTQTLSFEDNPSFYGFSRTVQAIFRGNYEEVDGEYDIFFTIEEGLWQLALVPKDASIKALISSFLLKGRNDLDEFIINESTGDRISYSFINIQYPPQFTDEENSVLP